MTIHPSARRLTALFALALSFAACKAKEKDAEVATPSSTPPVAAVAPFRVTALELGNAIDASKNVPAPTQVFAAGDTIYAVVASEGASPSTTLAARSERAKSPPPRTQMSFPSRSLSPRTNSAGSSLTKVTPFRTILFSVREKT